MTNPIIDAIDRMTAAQERRHSWLNGTSEKERAWREEDRRNGIIWNDETPEADGAGGRRPAPLAPQQGEAA